MNTQNLIATAQASINAPVPKVWKALTDPALIKQYMFGATVKSDWKKGSAITWSGEMNGKKYEDRGEILNIEPEKALTYSHFSPLSGQPDVPENYHTVSITLAEEGDATAVTLTQDKNGSEKEKAESEKNWNSMLQGLKKIVE